MNVNNMQNAEYTQNILPDIKDTYYILQNTV